ncbi:MAG: FkbM family methyltransferase [Planctomycetia bacterium]|nr:FkbM family methyltransferase [Planctomycetia bacterium]
MIRKFQALLQNIAWLLRSGGLRRHLVEQQDRFEKFEARIVSLCEPIPFLARRARSHGWVYGHHMALDPDDTVVSPRLCVEGSFEHLETELVLNEVRAGDIVVDVGANIGYYTLLFARRVGPAGHVYAFEPDPRNFSLLKRNVLQNGYDNVTCVPCAVSERSGSLRLFRNDGNRGDHRIYDSHDGRQVIETACLALDDFFADVARPVNFIKMDIQGAEARAWRGMQRLIANSAPNLRIVTEFWPRGLTLCGDDPRQFLNQLLALGFDVDVIDEATHRILPADPESLLLRLPVEPDHDLLFTNLLCRRRPIAQVA